jgi:hypothetical protein
MDSVFLVKEGYPEFSVMGVHSTLEAAKKAAETLCGSYTTLTYIVEKWSLDGWGVATSIWHLDGIKWREVLKDGEFVPYKG